MKEVLRECRMCLVSFLTALLLKHKINERDITASVLGDTQCSSLLLFVTICKGFEDREHID